MAPLTPRRQARDNAARKVAAAALTALLALSCSEKNASEPQAGTGGNYNVLFITLDTTRADHIGGYGDARAETPNLDRLIASGIRFDQAISAAPLTFPSHASIFTGLLPLHHGVRNNGAATLPEEIPTLASELSRNGYRTGAFVGSFVLDRRFGLAHGFDQYDDEIERDPQAGGNGLDAERPGRIVVDRATAWLERKDARPFFAWVHLFDPHLPYAPPEPYRTRFADRLYDGEIAETDEQVGRLLAILDKIGAREHTVIVVSGDHGEALGEHGELSHGLLLYEPTLRVPLIFNAPSLFRSAVVRSPVSLVDLAPTVASLVGHPMTAGRRPLDGSDLSATILKGSEPPLTTVYSETEYPTIFGWSSLAAMRRQSTKYIAAPQPEIYDLASDPGETRNVLDSRRRQFSELRSGLDALRSTKTEAPSGTTLDAEARARLASLGYVGGPSQKNDGERPDPKVMVPLFRRFEEAQWALTGGKASEAKTILAGLVKSDPGNPVFRGTLARVYRRLGEYDNAIAEYRDAAGASPSDPEAWSNLGAALYEAGRPREAFDAIQQAIRRDPKHPEAHNQLGVVLSMQGKLDQARAEFERAVALDPRNAQALNNLGNSWRSSHRFVEAAEAYQRAAGISPRYADPLNGLGTLAIQSNAPDKALQYFDAALQRAPGTAEFLLNRGIAHQELGHRQAAIEDYRLYLAAAGKDPGRMTERRTVTQLIARLSDDSKFAKSGGR